ncbi:MAG TPA: signal peptidase II [Phycisphaerales bacterium]|nr:signal peptidase II [Phycisphaerales bacterium]
MTNQTPSAHDAGSVPDRALLHHHRKEHGDGSTLRSVRAWVVLFTVTFLGLLADLGSKWWAFEKVAGVPVEVRREDVLAVDTLGRLIPSHPPVVVVPNLLEFTLVLNPGAVFGIGAGKRWFFVVVTIAAIAFAMWMFARWTSPRKTSMHVAIGLLISGAIGNLYDRLLYACVRDFIHPLPGVKLPFGWTLPNGSREVWPYVSNVADLFLLIAIGMLLVYSWVGARPHSQTGQEHVHTGASTPDA